VSGKPKQVVVIEGLSLILTLQVGCILMCLILIYYLINLFIYWLILI